MYRNAFERLSGYDRQAGAKSAAAGLVEGSRCSRPRACRPQGPDAVIEAAIRPIRRACRSSATLTAPTSAPGVAPVRVLGPDPYRLDGDDDGLGCE